MTTVNRRTFIARTAAIGGTATALAAPAIAQTNPDIKWRMPMFVPKSLEVHWNEMGEFAQRVADATDGKFQIQRFGAGEIVPGGPAVLDAVETGTVECGYTLAYYSVGKDPTYAFATTLPFGFGTRLQLSWWLRGGGSELMGAFFKTKNLVAVPIGNSTAQMGGWFRKEIKTLADLKGLKMRIPGLAGQVMAKLGAVPQQLAAGEIFTALERGTIDAAEWAHPAEDERMGFQKVAPFYYAPGWWEPNAMIHLFINDKAWEALPKHYRAIVTAAALATHQNLCAKYDQLNSIALRRLIAGGAKLSFFSNDILDAAHAASFQIYEDIARQNAGFAKVYAPWKKYLDDNELYLRVAENSYESYAFSKRARG
jgi:TRAP-type mannitol/chloroaromatic compound transport system substrate-binding protein